MDKEKSLMKFLSFFGSPFVGLLREKGVDSEKKFSISKYRSIPELVRINSECPYSLNFTPNGNFGDKVVIGNDATGIRTHKNCKDNDVNCFYVEVDVKFSQSQTKEELLQHITSSFIRYRCNPSFLIETPNGYHIYWLLGEDAKKIATFDGVFSIMDFLIDVFEADTSNAFKRNKYMRVPYSQHWKSGSPIEVKIRQIVDNNWTDVPDFEKVFYVTEVQYKNAIRYSEEKKNSEKRLQKTMKNFSSEVVGSLSQIKMSDLINNKLQGIPMSVGHKDRVFSVDSHGAVRVNGEKTDGYRLNKGENYINCFTKEYHPIDERPRGGIVSFLYYYLNRDFTRVNHFLKEKYDISLFKRNDNEMENEIERVDMLDYSVIFSNLRVSISKILTSAKGETTRHDAVVVRKPVTIIGGAKVFFNRDFTMSDQPDDVYLMDIDGESSVVRRGTCSKKFNEKNKGIISWYGNDHDLLMFFEALETSGFPEMDVVERNGYYLDNLFIGGRGLHEESQNSFNAIQCKYDISFGDDADNVSVKEFYGMMRKVFKEDAAACALLGGIACAGMNLRGSKNVYPGVLVTGLTGTGKSTIRDMVKWALGYEKKSRQYDFRGLTPQPLKQYATDNSILWLEEITGKAKFGTEDVLHSIMNRDNTARGTAGGNISYDLQSPLFCTGERMFSGESINNRFVVIPFGMSDREPSTTRNDIMYALDKKITREVYTTYIDQGKFLDERYEHAVKKIAEKGIDSRSCEVRAYLFVVNEIFGYILPEERLLEIAKKMLTKIGMGVKKTISPEKELYFFLSSAFASREPRIIGFYHYNDNNYDFQFVNDEFYESSRAKINTLIDGLLEKKVKIRQTEKGFSLYLDTSACISHNLDFVSPTEYNLYILLENAKTIGKNYVTVQR